MTIVALADVSRNFGNGGAEAVALKGVSIEVRRGEYIAVVGDSGSGKSTLVGILGMLDAPSSGQYFLDGLRVDGASAADQARLRSENFSHIFQAFHLLERRPAVDSVGLALLYRGLAPQAILSRSLSALNALGLADRAWIPGGLLSGGERQRVAVARGIASRTPFLIADEPTGNLDSSNSERVIASLEEANRAGAAVLLVTHSAETAARANRLIRLHDGEIVQETSGEPSDVPDVADGPPGRPSRVSLRSMCRDVWLNVISRRGRMLGYAVAIAVSVALVMTTLGIAYSASHQVSLAFDVATSRELTVTRVLTEDMAPLADGALERISALNGVEAVADATESTVQIQRNWASELVDAPHFAIRGNVIGAGRLSLEAGSSLSSSGLKPGEALIGHALAARLNVPSARADATMLIDGEEYVVRGVIEDSPREASWIGAVLTASASAVSATAHESRTLVTTAAGAAPQVAQELALVIDPARPESVDVSSPPDPSGMRQQVESSVQLSLILFTLATVLGSVVAIALASLSAATERRVEFGLRRAVGARRVHILSMLAGEATVYGVVGSVVGAFLGLATLLTSTIINRWTPIFDMRVLLVAVCAGVLVAILGSGAGAVRALGMQPSDALRPFH